jgi:para-nitrobenzyl esterase
MSTEPQQLPADCRRAGDILARLGDKWMRMVRILNAVRKCPSGALGIGIDAVRDPNLSDTKRPPQIEVTRDGPYRVTGNVRLVDENGVLIPQKSYWVNFAMRGDPNGSGLPPWPAYDEEDVVQILDTTIEARPNPQAARFRFLSSFRQNGILPICWRDVP